MTKKLIWRLGKLPTVLELNTLVNDKIITKEEARDILFNTASDEERDSESLKQEIKFLREVIDNLSKKKATVIETIKYIKQPYYVQPWFNGYQTYCGNAGVTVGTYTSAVGSSTNAGALLSGTITGGNQVSTLSAISNF